MSQPSKKGGSSDRKSPRENECFEKPSERKPLAAVRWLLGPDLIARGKDILRERPEPRAWMLPVEGKVHDETRVGRGKLVEEDTTSSSSSAPDEDDVWFDYVADVGDSGEAMHAIAVGLQKDLPLDEKAREWVDKVLGGEPAPASIELERWSRSTVTTNGGLPRGQFLFVGGDTAYHVADEITIRQKVQKPFLWAWEDLGDQVAPRGPENAWKNRARIYGIPGNHDWYAALGGFAALFHRPLTHLSKKVETLKELFELKDRIALPGFKAVQRASYAAIKLPHGWRIWGLDIDSLIDPKQRDYFRGLGDPESKRPKPPSRLILCTPSPPIVFDSIHLHPFHEPSLYSLELLQSYLEQEAPPGACRLDLSGDTHHYARYQKATGASYAAVVSGLGGAFHHPTFTVAGPIQAARKFPSYDASRMAVGEHLLGIRPFLVGSWIRVVPALLTLFYAWVLKSKVSSGNVLQWFLSWRPGGTMPPFPDAKVCGELWGSAYLLLALVGAVLVIVLGVRIFACIATAQAKDPKLRRSLLDVVRHGDWCLIASPQRSYWLPSLLFAGAVVGLTMERFLCPEPAIGKALLDVFALVFALLPIGGAIAAVAFGAKKLPLAKKVLVGVLGFVHGLMQIAIPMILAQTANVHVDVAHALPAAGIAFLVVAGTWTVLHFSRLVFELKSAPLASPLLALLLLACGLGAVVGFGGPLSSFTVNADTPGLSLLLVFCAAFCAAFVCTAYLGWYLAIAGRLDAHNNEVGSAARVTSFRQFIRFHVGKDALRGYVIAIDSEGDDWYDVERSGGGRLRRLFTWRPKRSAVTDEKASLSFKLVDVFEVRPPGPND